MNCALNQMVLEKWVDLKLFGPIYLSCLKFFLKFRWGVFNS